jgi:hypothetical protein
VRRPEESAGRVVQKVNYRYPLHRMASEIDSRSISASPPRPAVENQIPAD